MPYGPKLAELKVTNEIDKNELLRIASACLNVILDFAQYNRSFTETVIALGRATTSWSMAYSDKDSGVFGRVGLSCPNLSRISVKTMCEGFSATSFGGLFSLPKQKLRVLDVAFGRASYLSIVFKVVAEKHDSLTSFSCLGDSLCVEDVRVFLASQKNLKRVDFHTEGWCTCWNRRNRPGHGPISNMGSDWRSIVNTCINHSNVTEIECSCNAAGYGSERNRPDFSSAFPAAQERDLSIEICETKVY